MNRPRTTLLSVLLLSAALTMLGTAPAALAAIEGQADSLGTAPTVFSPNRVIVQWTPGSDRGERAEAREEADVASQASLGRSFQLVAVEPGQTPAEAVAALEADPAVVAAGRDGYSSLDAVPNDTLFNQLWGLRNLGLGINGFGGAVAGADANVVAAWDRAIGSPSTVIAVIDSGYRFTHPDLGPVAWTNPGETANGADDDGNGIVDDLHGADFVGPNAEASVLPKDGDPTDDDLLYGGHGVHTAGTAAAAGNDGFGITGVSRNARIMPLRVCAPYPSLNDARCPHSSQIAAINYAGAKGARVANISLGGTFKEQLVANALGSNPQTLFVISAGNDGTDNEVTHHYPCDFNPDVDTTIPTAIDNVICVAATNQADGLAGFSDYGAVSVDLGAPGTETLSAYPRQNLLFSDNFEVNNFASKWTVGGAGFGRAGTGDGPLTSFGITDSPGTTPVANTLYEAKSNSISVVAGTGGCRIAGMRHRKGGALTYGLIVDEATERTFTSGETAGSSMVPFNTVPIANLSGHSVRLFFRYTADSSPSATEGIWLDDLKFSCYAPIGAPPSFEYLQGTSMATPHVTGAAGLLFSLKPSASVTQVRSAILASVDPIPSLAGKTVTGGRLDVADALSHLVPVGTETVAPDTAILAGPQGTVPDTSASFQFGRTDADTGAFECSLDGGAFAPCASPNSFTVTAGSHQFQVRAKVPSGLVDPTPATRSWTAAPPPPPPVPPPPPPKCKVPALAGKTLAQAKTALKAAGCALGKVTKPKAKKGKKQPSLIVKSSTPAVGATAPSGAVDLKLGPKPKKKRKKG